ncbi:hypothetical protein Tco_1492042 [Tanacetum coccineum]
MHVIVDWKMYRRQELKLMIRYFFFQNPDRDAVDAEIVGIMADPKEVSVLASHSRCRSAEAVPKKKIKKGKGHNEASDIDVQTKQEKEPSAVTDAGEVAGTSGMSSFAWILSKMLPATSESGIHAARTRCHCSDMGADWPPIIEEKEMPNAVRCEDSFVEKIVRRNNVTIDELPKNHSNTLPLKAVSKRPLTAPFVWFSGLK